MQGKEVKAMTAPRVQPVMLIQELKGVLVSHFQRYKEEQKDDSLKLRTHFHQISSWQETHDGLKFKACAMREEVWHAATKQSDNAIKGSVSFPCSKQAGSGGTAQFVIFLHSQGCPVNRLSINICVWKQSSCGSLWKMWKYHRNPPARGDCNETQMGEASPFNSDVTALNKSLVARSLSFLKSKNLSTCNLL